MKTASITDKQTSLQLITRAESELIVLQRQEEEIQAALRKTTAELATITARTEGRLQQLETANSTVAELQAAFAQAKAHASLAEGTLASGNDETLVRDLEKCLARAEQDLAAMQARLAKEQTSDESKATALQSAKAKAEQDLTAISTQQQAFAGAKQKAIADLGQAEYNALMLSIQAWQNDIATKQAELVRAKMALQRTIEAGITSLQNWPELQQQVRPLLSYSDNATQVLESAIAFLDQLLTHGHGADIDTDILHQAGLAYTGMAELLTLHTNFFWPALAGRPADALAERRVALEKVLSVYRASKR